jgi:hypothetical protein
MEATDVHWSSILLARRGPRSLDLAAEVRRLVATASACASGTEVFRLQGRSSVRFDPTSERALRAALVHAEPGQLNARAGIPCRLVARSDGGRVVELSWPAISIDDEPIVEMLVRWPLPHEESAAVQAEALVRVVRAFAEPFAPCFVEVGPVEPSETIPGGAWLVAQPNEVSSSVGDGWPLARSAAPIAGLAAFIAHGGSPFSASPGDGEARRELLRVARTLRHRPPAALVDDRLSGPPPAPPAPSTHPGRFGATVALDALPRPSVSTEVAHLPFRGARETSDAFALVANASESTPLSGATIDVGSLSATPPALGSLPPSAAPLGPPSSATVALDGPPGGTSMPFHPSPHKAAANSAVEAPEFTLEQYASLCVEVAHSPLRLEFTLSRYRITPEQRAALDSHWRARFMREPALRAAFAQAFAAYRAMVSSRGS